VYYHQIRPSWDEYFLQISEVVSIRGDCKRRKVGAVISDEQHRIVACGYNGTLTGKPGCLSGNCPRGKFSNEQIKPGSSYKGNCIAIHAERNALTYFWKTVESGLRIRTGSCTMYVSEPPCKWCLTLIQGAGLRRVVYREDNLLKDILTPGLS
jgi:dCMP deaminase